MNDAERSSYLDKMLRQRLSRSAPIEEGLMQAGMGKRPLPTVEECREWSIKLGVPDEMREFAPAATPQTEIERLAKPSDFTAEFRMAISGEGRRAYDWDDKPHRLVYDLCRYIEENDISPDREAAIRREALEEALTPSGDTKAAYMGEFKFGIAVTEYDEDEEQFVEVHYEIYVPWDTIKQIMKAIHDRALIATPDKGGAHG